MEQCQPLPGKCHTVLPETDKAKASCRGRFIYLALIDVLGPFLAHLVATDHDRTCRRDF